MSPTRRRARFDVFISYSHRNEAWVRGWLVPKLKNAELKVCIDYESFEPGAPSITEMERAVLESRKTVLVLSPQYFESNWGEFENTLAQTLDPAAHESRIIPLLFMPCDLPPRIGRLTYIDFTDPATHETVLSSLVEAVRKHVRKGVRKTRVQPSIKLEQLDHPAGALGPDSPFYVKRAADEQTRTQVLKRGSTTLVVGARQMGKSSLLAHTSYHAEQNHYRVVQMNFQRLHDAALQTLDDLLLYLAHIIARRLGTAVSPDTCWGGPLESTDKLSEFLYEYVLAEATHPVVLVLDEVDRVFDYPYRDNFFGLIRSWHDTRATDRQWKRLNLVLAYSTDPRGSIQKLNQSPFNVGLKIRLTDFDVRQVEPLNDAYRKPIAKKDIPRLMDFIGGHPFLIHQAIYTVATGMHSLEDLLELDRADEGPFADYLYHPARILEADSPMCEAMRQVIDNHSCPDNERFDRLRAIGLIVGRSRQQVKPRCRLYAEYLQKRLSWSR